MSDEPIPSLAEAMAEIRRLRDVLDEIHRHCSESPSGAPADRGGRWAAEVASQALAAMRLGTLAKPAEDEPPFQMEHNFPPSAPPHNE